MPLVLAAALMLGSVPGCGTGPPEDVVTIGYSGPLSGGAALYGRNALAGVRMAVEEINAAGGVEVDGRGLPLRVAALDDRYLSSETGTNARRLLEREGASAIVVPHAAGILALQGMRERLPAFLLMAYSSDPSVLQGEDPLTLMIPARYDAYVAPFVERTITRFGPRLGLLPTTTVYGRGWGAAAVGAWEARGGEVVGNHGVDYNTTTDFTGVVARALADAPDVLLVGGPSQPTALVIRAAREQGFQGGFIILEQAKLEEIEEIVPRSALEGAVGVHPMETYPGPGVSGFVRRFREAAGAAGGPLVSEFAQNYQATHLLARAMELAGTTTDLHAIRERMDEAARTLPDEVMLVRYTGIDPRGEIGREIWAVEVVNGALAPFRVDSEGGARHPGWSAPAEPIGQGTGARAGDRGAAR